MADTAAAGLLAAGGSTTVTSTLQMNDTGVSQNSCFDAPLVLHLSSNLNEYHPGGGRFRQSLHWFFSSLTADN
jgi:hypothetical protein